MKNSRAFQWIGMIPAMQEALTMAAGQVGRFTKAGTILALLFTLVTSPARAAMSEDCAQLLLGHLQKQSPASFQPAKHLDAQLQAARDALVVFRIPLDGVNLNLAALMDFSYAPAGLVIPSEFLSVSDGALFVIARGSGRNLEQFGRDLAQRRQGLTFQILDAQVEKRVFRLNVSQQLFQVNRTAGNVDSLRELNKQFDSLLEKGESFTVFDVQLGQMVFIYPKADLAPIAGSAELLRGLKLDLIEGQRKGNMIDWLKLNREELSGDAVIIPRAAHFILNQSAFNKVRTLEGKSLNGASPTIADAEENLLNVLRNCSGDACVPVVEAALKSPKPAILKDDGASIPQMNERQANTDVGLILGFLEKNPVGSKTVYSPHGLQLVFSDLVQRWSKPENRTAAIAEISTISFGVNGARHVLMSYEVRNALLKAWTVLLRSHGSDLAGRPVTPETIREAIQYFEGGMPAVPETAIQTRSNLSKDTAALASIVRVGTERLDVANILEYLSRYQRIGRIDDDAFMPQIWLSLLSRVWTIDNRDQIKRDLLAIDFQKTEYGMLMTSRSQKALERMKTAWEIFLVANAQAPRAQQLPLPRYELTGPAKVSVEPEQPAMTLQLSENVEKNLLRQGFTKEDLDSQVRGWNGVIIENSWTMVFQHSNEYRDRAFQIGIKRDPSNTMKWIGFAVNLAEHADLEKKFFNAASMALDVGFIEFAIDLSYLNGAPKHLSLSVSGNVASKLILKHRLDARQLDSLLAKYMISHFTPREGGGAQVVLRTTQAGLPRRLEMGLARKGATTDAYHVLTIYPSVVQ